MGVLEILIIFVCGVIFGSLIQRTYDTFIYYRRTGKLNIIKTDGEEPYIYLESFEKVENIEKRKYVVLTVNKQYIDTPK